MICKNYKQKKNPSTECDGIYSRYIYSGKSDHKNKIINAVWKILEL